MKTLLLVWAALILVLGCTVEASAPALRTGGLHHLVRPGDDWSLLASRVQPGDEIILMPGQHRPASFDDLRGEPGRPITIRSAGPDHPAVIQATRKGIRLRNPRHVVIRDLTITGATISGISISGPRADVAHAVLPGGHTSISEDDAAALEQPWPAHVRIQNVTISNTGPHGRRHGIRLAALEDVVVEQCTIRGWGGAAVSVAACRNVRIERSAFTGLEDHDQESGIEVRAGSKDVRILHCEFVDAGMIAIALGGTSNADEFRPPLQENQSPRDAVRFEAGRVDVQRCVIRGGASAFAIQHVNSGTIRNNLIERPRSVVYLILNGHEHPAIGPTSRVTFSANLFHWEPDDLRQLSIASEHASSSGVILEQNLWWSPDLAERREALGKPFGTIRWEQVMDVDPQLDDEGRPRHPQAAIFGQHAP